MTFDPLFKRTTIKRPGDNKPVDRTGDKSPKSATTPRPAHQPGHGGQNVMIPSGNSGGAAIEPAWDGAFWQKMKSDKSPPPHLVKEGLMSLFASKTLGDFQKGLDHAPAILDHLQSKFASLIWRPPTI